MESSIPKTLATLRELQAERRRLLKELMGDEELAVGTVSVVSRKCGNPRCRCARGGDGHRQTLFLFKDDEGKRRCKLVRRADEPRLLAAGERDRSFRQSVKRLRAIDRQEKQILMALRGMRALHYE